MKRISYVIFSTMIISICQSSFFNTLFGSALNPNFVLAFTFSLLLMDEEELSMISAFIGGLFMDLVSVGVIGTNSFVYTILVYILYLFRKYLFKNFSFQIILILMAFIIDKIVHNTLTQNGSNQNYWIYIFSAATGVVTTMAFYLLNSYIKEKFMKSDYRLR